MYLSKRRIKGEVDVGIKYLRPVKDENKIKWVADSNKIRIVGIDSFTNPSNYYVGLSEPNNSDYAYESLKLLLLRFIDRHSGFNERLNEVLNDIDCLLDSIYETEFNIAIHNNFQINDFSDECKSIINRINDICGD